MRPVKPEDNSITKGYYVMVKHIILWKLKEDLTDAEKAEVRKNAKAALEGLAGKIDGLVSIYVRTEYLPTSNADMMLDSMFTDSDALLRYSKHPLHVSAADTYVRPFVSQRLCMDFED